FKIALGQPFRPHRISKSPNRMGSPLPKLVYNHVAGSARIPRHFLGPGNEAADIIEFVQSCPLRIRQHHVKVSASSVIIVCRYEPIVVERLVLPLRQHILKPRLPDFVKTLFTGSGFKCPDVRTIWPSLEKLLSDLLRAFLFQKPLDRFSPEGFHPRRIHAGSYGAKDTVTVTPIFISGFELLFYFGIIHGFSEG